MRYFPRLVGQILVIQRLPSWTQSISQLGCRCRYKRVTAASFKFLIIAFSVGISFLGHSYSTLSTKQLRRYNCSLIAMFWASVLAAMAALTGHVSAQNMLRFACSQLVVERTDPLVNPGMKYTPHLHQIVGGDAFNITMDPSNDIAQLSKCTSCSFTQDKSNYWTAVMFFKAKNGTYTRVPQVYTTHSPDPKSILQD